MIIDATEPSSKRRRIDDSVILEESSFPRRDRISEVPDDINVIILSFLNMKDAAQTSVLSKRWRYTWTYLSKLDFDPEKCLGWEDGHSDYTIFKYVMWVNRVVMASRAQTLEKFRVYYYLDAKYASHIDRWVNICSKKGVHELELNFDGGYGNCHDEYYTFGSLCHAYLPQDACMIPNFTNLRSFCVEVLRISGSFLELLLSNCLFLEQLCVTWCKGVGSLKVAGSSLKLKYLKIVNCDVEKVEVSAPNLVTIVYRGRQGDLVCNSIPSLVEADFGGGCARRVIDQTSLWSFQLERLSVTVIVREFFSTTTFPTFGNLKRLTATHAVNDDDCLFKWAYFIDACPSLREFKLELRWARKPMKGTGRRAKITERQVKRTLRRVRGSDCVHLSLDAVYFAGFVGSKIEEVFAFYLVEKAPLLKKFTLDCRDPVRVITGHKCSDPDAEKPSRKHAKRLAKELRPGLDVVILSE